MHLFKILCLLFFSAAVFADESLDKVVAVVNSTTITQSQLVQQMKISRDQLQAQNAPIPADLRKQVLNQLIDNALQLEVAKKANITVSDADVSHAIAKIAQQNNITVDQLMKSVTSQGMSANVYREQIRQEMLLSQVQQKMIGPQVKVTSQDVSDATGFLSTTPRLQQQNPNLQYHIIDVLVPTKEKADALINSKNLQTTDPDIQTTDMGFRPLAQFPSIFTAAIQSLKPGQASQPIKAPNGYHILQLVAVNGPQTAPKPAMSAQQLAFQHKFVEAQQAWIQKLRAQSYVKVMDE